MYAMTIVTWLAIFMLERIVKSIATQGAWRLQWWQQQHKQLPRYVLKIVIKIVKSRWMTQQHCMFVS